MTTVQIAALRNNVSRYVRRAQQGETIVILNRTRPAAVLEPYRAKGRPKGDLLGCLKGTARDRGDLVRATIPPGEWFTS